MILLLAAACGRSTAPLSSAADQPQIRLNLDAAHPATVHLVGLPATILAQLERAKPTREEWTALLRVTVAGATNGATDRPAVLGTYAIHEGALRFTPQFPLDPGQRYDVVFDPSQIPPGARDALASSNLSRLVAIVEVPAREHAATTKVVDVYPSAPEVPENQLRMYILFSAPMGLRAGAENVRLLDERGEAIVDPFLPLDVDLWNEDRTRFTLLFDPGRVKRGILPNEQMGRSLVAGRKYTLVIDAAWRDTLGQPLTAPFRRDFRVGPPVERPLDPGAWRINAPREGTSDPLVVSFPAPLDHALLHRALSVSDRGGARLAGEIRLQESETRWLFTPSAPWHAGEYELHAASTLEDVAGNRIGKAFEVDERTQSGAQARSVAIPFQIAPRAQ